MALQGVNVLIIIAENGAATATAADDAGRVKGIAYDRLIKSPNISAYISFDNTEVGRAEARGIIKVRDNGNFVLLGGSPTDNNAILVRNGQMEILKPSSTRARSRSSLTSGWRTGILRRQPRSWRTSSRRSTTRSMPLSPPTMGQRWARCRP